MSQLKVLGGNGGTIELTGDDGVQVLAPSRLFRLEVDGVLHDTMEVRNVLHGPHETTVEGRVEGTSLAIRWTAREIAGPGAWELSLTLINEGIKTQRVSRMDPLAAQLVGGGWDSLYFRSTWGKEFTPEKSMVGEGGLHLECRSGGSSHGYSPWLGLEKQGAGLLISPAWSGNWHIDIDSDAQISAGISPWEFFTDLALSDQVRAPAVVIAVSSNREEAAVLMTTALGKSWIPRSAASDALPISAGWIVTENENEDVLWATAAIVAEIGMDVTVVDAGWYGASDMQSDWPTGRGDWNLTNFARLPSGLAKLGEGIRARGTKAGIWMEAEAVGRDSELRRARPEIMAYAPKDWKRDESYPKPMFTVDPRNLDESDPTFLGYVCMGSPEGREFVAHWMDTIVREMGAEWFKLDFNMDLDRGCGRTDHGHGEGDGLFRHYEGLYAVLDEFRRAHPEVVFESCSSGGLRVDLGLARHVHFQCLSDITYTEHHLQVVWGTSLMLPPVAILQSCWAEWRPDHPFQLPIRYATLDRHQLDNLLRAVMIHRPAFSLRLLELTPEQLDSLTWHTNLFSKTIAPFVRTGVMRRLTDQPLRGGQGELAPVFQLSTGDRHLVAAFRLDGGSTPKDIFPKALKENQEYKVTDLATGSVSPFNSSIVLPTTDAGVSSWLMLIEPVNL